MREALFDLVADRFIGFTHQCPELLGKVILSTGIPNKVQYGAALFIARQSQAAPQLLQEDGEAFRWS